MINQPKFFKPNYKEEQGKCLDFLTSFEDISISEHDKYSRLKYLIELQRVADQETKKIEIFMEDIEEYFKGDPHLINHIYHNTVRYQQLFSQAADQIMPNPSKPINPEDDAEESYEDILNRQRIMNVEGLENNTGNLNSSKQVLHPLIKRKFELYIVRGPQIKNVPIPIRAMKALEIGSLITVKAIVVRVTDVKPMIQVACYVCDICGFETYQTVNSKAFFPLVECSSKQCVINKVKGKLILQTGTSLYKSYQEIIIQETSDQVPQGNIPKQFQVIAKGENVRMCQPGDNIIVQGVFLPMQDDSFKSRNKLVMNTFIEAYQIIREKKKYLELTLSEEVLAQIENERQQHQDFKDLYEQLAKSLAPEIFGMEDVKKALLLLMVGGVTIEKNDGMRIRGDINIALIGDPGIAKSQLLKYVAHVSPRGVYATGKGSSGVGLTASVIKDPITNEVSLEGGALVLADMGVCCIDEFDKMDEFDRTSIHEVMEQQSVSIAKAGITTTLNARTSILAAANPLYGRYNKNKTPHENINLPAALLSRFDLVFILLDRHDKNMDELLAKHIGLVHQNQKAPNNDQYYSKEFLRAFIAKAKQYSPMLSQDLHEFLVQRYVEKRKQQMESDQKGYQYITPRTLLGIIRLAQGMAKLRFSDQVNQFDIDEAIRLMDISQESVQANGQEEEYKHGQDSISNIWRIIKEACHYSKDRSIKRSDLEKKIINQGLIVSDLDKTIEYYKALNAIMVSDRGDLITTV